MESLVVTFIVATAKFRVKENDVLVGFCLEDFSGGEAGDINLILYMCSFLFEGIPFSYLRIKIKL